MKFAKTLHLTVFLVIKLSLDDNKGNLKIIACTIRHPISTDTVICKINKNL